MPQSKKLTAGKNRLNAFMGSLRLNEFTAWDASAVPTAYRPGAACVADGSATGMLMNDSNPRHGGRAGPVFQVSRSWDGAYRAGRNTRRLAHKRLLLPGSRF